MQIIYKNRLPSNGFTLIEMIVSVTIIGFIALTMSMFLVSSGRSFEQIQSRKTVTHNNIVSIESFSRELRLTHSLITTNAKSLAFTSTSDTNLVINYQINNDGTFTRSLGGGNNNLVAQNIDFDGSYFNYYDINDNAGTPIRRIRLSLLFTSNNNSSRYTVDVSPYTFR